MQKVNVGSLVLYTNLGDADGRYPPEQQAAIVTKVKDEKTVSLKIFYPTGLFDMSDVPYSKEYKRGCWSWSTKEDPFEM